jgi:Domain of unknown function (DUF4112)
VRALYDGVAPFRWSERRLHPVTPPAEPELIPPNAPWPRGSTAPLSDESLDRLARFLDDGVAVPGTQIRFGLDPIIGLIPGIGDMLGALASFVFVFAGWRRGLPGVTLVRMVANIVIDSLAGTLPVFGDLFDFFWKSNRMNYNLLRRHSLAPYVRHTWRDWLFLWAVLAIVIATALLPLVVLIWIVHLLRT